MDYSLFKDINGLTGHSLADTVFKALAKDMPAVMVVLVALVFLIRWRQHREERRSGAVLATASAGLSLLIAQPIAHAVDRLRPFAAHPGHAHVLIARSPDPSFPSDHAAGAFALAFGIWLYDRTLGSVLLVLGAILAFARVYVGAHYPGDVIAGALLGMGVVATLYLLPPLRRAIEAIARRGGRVWDRITRTPAPARQPL